MRLTAWVLELRLVLQQTKAPATGFIIRLRVQMYKLLVPNKFCGKKIENFATSRLLPL